MKTFWASAAAVAILSLGQCHAQFSGIAQGDFLNSLVNSALTFSPKGEIGKELDE